MDKSALAELEELYHCGQLSSATYYSLMEALNPAFARIPRTYAEIDYGDREDAEAYDGSRWDDMNYLHYFER